MQSLLTPPPLLPSPLNTPSTPEETPSIKIKGERGQSMSTDLVSYDIPFKPSPSSTITSQHSLNLSTSYPLICKDKEIKEKEATLDL